MVVITGTAVATISLVSLIVGGGGVFVYFKYLGGDSDWPNISNSSFGTFDWEKTSKNDLIGLEFDFNSGGVIFEVGMILTFMFVIILFCCCGCRHLPTPKCLKEKNVEAQKKFRLSYT